MTDKSDKVTGPRVRQFFTRLPPNLAREVEAAATKELLSIASYCRRAIAEAVRGRSSGRRRTTCQAMDDLSSNLRSGGIDVAPHRLTMSVGNSKPEDERGRRLHPAQVRRALISELTNA